MTRTAKRRRTRLLNRLRRELRAQYGLAFRVAVAHGGELVAWVHVPVTSGSMYLRPLLLVSPDRGRTWEPPPWAASAFSQLTYTKPFTSPDA